jgi:hypothetical protein
LTINEVLRLVERAGHPVAVRVELPPVSLGQGDERGLVAGSDRRDDLGLLGLGDAVTAKQPRAGMTANPPAAFDPGRAGKSSALLQSSIA